MYSYVNINYHPQNKYFFHFFIRINEQLVQLRYLLQSELIKTRKEGECIITICKTKDWFLS